MLTLVETNSAAAMVALLSIIISLSTAGRPVFVCYSLQALNFLLCQTSVVTGHCQWSLVTAGGHWPLAAFTT